jgi:hypothetical protein
VSADHMTAGMRPAVPRRSDDCGIAYDVDPDDVV